MKKRGMRKASLLALSALLVGISMTQWNVRASANLSDYEDRMLAGFEYDQNNFEEIVSKRIIPPANLTNPSPFAAGVKYNAYQPKGENGSQMTIGEMNATNESVITVALWMNLNQTNSSGIMPFSIGGQSIHHAVGRLGFNTGNNDIYGVDLPRNGNWTHVVATFHKDDFYKNTLYLNGKKQTLTKSAEPLTSEPNLSRTSWQENTIVTMGGKGNYTLKEESLIDELHVFSGDMTDGDVQNLFNLSRVPELNAFQENNKAKLEWAVSTFNPNPFYKTSFEAGEDMPTVPKDIYKTVALQSKDAYNGTNAVEFNYTTDLRGNGFYYPSTTANRSTFNFTQRKYVPNGTPVSLSFKAKATERASVQPSGIGGAASSTIDHHKIYGGQPKVFLEDAPKGSKVLKISNVHEIPNRAGVWVADRYIPVPQHEGPFYSYAEVKEIDLENSTITLNKGLAEDFKAGQLLQGHRSVNPITFPSQVVPGDGEWKNININTTVNDFDHFDTMIRGFLLYFYVETAGTVQIDDVELIEATRSELFRGDTLVYSGYNSQFVDNQAIDKLAPDAVDVSKVEMKHDVAKVTLSKPNDNGSHYDYKIRGVTSDGTQTVFSDTERVTVTSGIKGYAYAVDTAPSTIPKATVNSTSEVLSIPRTADTGTRYLHVRAIDNQGNAGETTHVKLESPSLTAAPTVNQKNPFLKWTFDLKTEAFSYKVYKKEKSATSFTTVPVEGLQFDDVTSIDVTKPNAITNPVFRKEKDGTYTADFKPATDVGNTYEYYVEAIGKSTGSTYVSSVKEVAIVSGVKGYAVEVSASPIPQKAVSSRPSAPLSFTVPDSTRPGDAPFYIHLIAIDGEDNQSFQSTHFDSSTSYLIITPSETGWTNQDVTLDIKGSKGIGGIVSLRLPDGTVVNSPTAKFTVTENGLFPFFGKNEFGEWVTGGFEITNIDKTKPVIKLRNVPEDWSNQDTTIEIEVE